MINTIYEAFNTATINDNSICFPLEMTSGTYSKVKNMLTNIRGKYVGKADKGRFELPFNPTDIVNKYLTMGDWPKKNPFALFPTPPSVLNYALKYTFAGALEWTGYDLVRIFEPSAGTGGFIDAVVQDFKKHGIPVDVVCAEIDPVNIEVLKGKGYSLIEGDFLNVEVDSLAKFDLIITNPPFLGQKYISHVNHAQRFLKPYGKMMAVIPTTLFTATNKKSMALKHMVTALNIGEFQDCIFGSGTFENTKIETMLVVINSVERSLKDMENLTEYASRLMCLCLNNERTINEKINRCKTNKDVTELMPYLVRQYEALSPYSFLNDDVIKGAEATFKLTLPLNDKSTPKQKPQTIAPLVKTNALPLTLSVNDNINTITLVQADIRSTLTSIVAKIATISKCRTRKATKAINENQMDFFGFA